MGRRLGGGNRNEEGLEEVIEKEKGFSSIGFGLIRAYYAWFCFADL